MEKEISMMSYIRETPDVVLHNIENRKELTRVLVDEYLNNHYEGLTIVACGSSYNGCMAARYFMMQYLNTDVKLVNPFTFIHHEHDYRGNTMTVNVSQSGCSTNIIECVQYEKNCNERTISLVGRDDCDVKQYSDILVNWGVGEEKIGYVTKGVVTLATFWMLFSLEVAKRKEIINETKYEEVLDDLRLAMRMHSQIVDSTVTAFCRFEERFTGCNRVYAISSGSNLATATEGALKIAETSCITCVGLEVEEYLHGPIYPVNPDTLLIFIDNNNDSSSKRIVDVAIANQMITDRSLIITNDKRVSESYAIRTTFETDSLVSPLYKLAVVETLAYLRTEKTNEYKPHETVVQYERNNKKETKSRDNLIIDLQGL